MGKKQLWPGKSGKHENRQPDRDAIWAAVEAAQDEAAAAGCKAHRLTHHEVALWVLHLEDMLLLHTLYPQMPRSAVQVSVYAGPPVEWPLSGGEPAWFLESDSSEWSCWVGHRPKSNEGARNKHVARVWRDKLPNQPPTGLKVVGPWWVYA